MFGSPYLHSAIMEPKFKSVKLSG